jgi:hypothetical protein
MSKTPAFKRRLRNVTVLVWRNVNEKGPWYSVEFSRGFKKDDEWHKSHSFGVEDLPAQRMLIDIAAAWILNQQEADAKGKSQADNVTA